MEDERLPHYRKRVSWLHNIIAFNFAEHRDDAHRPRAERPWAQVTGSSERGVGRRGDSLAGYFLPSQNRLQLDETVKGRGRYLGDVRVA